MTVTRTLIIPDVHCPFQDNSAVQLMLKSAKDHIKPTSVVQIGDFLDCYELSEWDKMEDGPSFSDELAAGNEVLDAFDQVFANATTKIMLEGNHEYRARRQVARSRHLRAMISPIPDLLRLPARGWQWHAMGHYVEIAKSLYVVHGQHCGLIGLEKHRRKRNASVVYGHTHQILQSYSCPQDGNPHVAASVGWLGSWEMAEKYRNTNFAESMLCFASIVHRPSGLWQLHPHPIVNGEVDVYGKVVSL